MFRMARTPNRLRTGPVRLGEHNREIYCDLLGYSPDQLKSIGTARPRGHGVPTWRCGILSVGGITPSLGVPLPEHVSASLVSQS